MPALTGIKVLDLTRLLPGAIATLLLADMGADVIKVEDPQGGDYARWMPPLLDGVGAFFRASNRNKRSLILNLKDLRGQETLHRLAQSADVLIEGFRPGVTARLRCDYATLRAINPRLVYCSLSGWGQDGPYADISGHDLNYVALGGIQGATRTPQPSGGQIADVGGAYVSIMGILGALFQRERTGKGDFVDAALFEAGMPFAMYSFVESITAGLPGSKGTLTGGMAFYDVYLSSDGESLALAAIEPKFWQNFCNAVGHPEWLALHQDMAQQDTLKREISALFATKTAAEWDRLLSPADCCFTRITPPDKLADDPHVMQRGMAGVDSAGLPWMRSPVRLTSDDFHVGRAPGYGEHTRAVLSEAGFTPEEIEDLFTKGVVETK